MKRTRVTRVPLVTLNAHMDALPLELSTRIYKDAYAKHIKAIPQGVWNFHVRSFKRKKVGLLCDRRYKNSIKLFSTIMQRIRTFNTTKDEDEGKRRYYIEKLQSLMKKNIHFKDSDDPDVRANFKRIMRAVLEMVERTKAEKMY